jgi:hypothetical protein
MEANAAFCPTCGWRPTAAAIPGISTTDSPPEGRDPVAVEQVRAGQRFVIYAILMNVFAVIVQLVLVLSSGGSTADASVFGAIPLLTALARSVIALGFLYFAIVGLYRLASGLGYSTRVKLLLFVLMIVPLVSLFTLFYLNSKATPLLRRSGYRVGLLGARR